MNQKGWGWLLNRSLVHSSVHDVFTESYGDLPRPPPSLSTPHHSVADHADSLLKAGAAH